GEVAETAGQPTIKRNFQRASELVKISDERILEIYNALRPNRSSKEELLAIADELENKYGAIVNANFVREAAEIYEKRGKLRKD
ncbi:MAG: diol dehydratase small subunit, partial [Cetobacterium sp.]